MSTGPNIIGTFFDLNNAARAMAFCGVAHTSLHGFTQEDDFIYPSLYGATPHLDSKERQILRSFV